MKKLTSRLLKADANYFADHYFDSNLGRIGKYKDYIRDDENILGYIHRSSKKATSGVLAGGKTYPIKEKKNPLLANVGYLALENEKFVIVTRIRKLLILAILLFLLLLLIPLALSHNDTKKHHYFTPDKPKNYKVEKQVNYASYESVPEVVTMRPGRELDITLVLPKYTGKDPNTVSAAPSIWVKTGKKYKCLFNKQGILLKPGKQINKVKLTKALQKGTYHSKVIWTPIVKKTGKTGNQMVFNFTLKVS